MEFESKLAGKIAGMGKDRGYGRRKVVAVAFSAVMFVALFAITSSAKGEIIVVDEVNIGCVADESDHVLVGWSDERWYGPAGAGWGDFDLDDPYEHDATYSKAHNLRTVLDASEDPVTQNWAEVTLVAWTHAKIIEIRALDGIADDSFSVYVNDNPVYSYKDKAPLDDPEAWVTHRMPVKGDGPLVVKIVAKATPWWGQQTYGQMAVNWIKLYGVPGFDVFGYNYAAEIFNGWLGYYDRSIDGGWILGTGDAWLLMKWSPDWTPMIDEPVGAWVTNHYIWYSDDYSEDTWYGWDTRVAWSDPEPPAAAYKITEFSKIMKVGEDPAAWAEYEAGGAYSANWGTYPSGVPKCVVFQDTIDVFDMTTGMCTATFDLCNCSPNGLGQPIF